jgi:hypothetical protein
VSIEEEKEQKEGQMCGKFSPGGIFLQFEKRSFEGCVDL